MEAPPEAAKRHKTHKIKSEERIFRAAMNEFLEKGRYGARMQSIANRAGINKAMLHYYFRNKETLYGFVLKKAAAKFYGCLPDKLDVSMPFSVSLRLFIDAYIDLVNSNPRIPRFILREAAENPQGVRQLFREGTTANGNRLWLKFSDMVNKAVQQGLIRPMDPLQLYMTVLGAGLYPFLTEPALPPSFAANRDAFIRERKKHLFDVVFNGIRP